MIASLAMVPMLATGCDDDPGHGPPADASPPDASSPDATPADARLPDAQPTDAGPGDAQPPADGPGDPGDGVPPRVIASTPEAGADGVATEVEIRVTFDEDIAPSSVDAASFAVVDDRQHPIIGTLAVEGAQVTFRPVIELTFRERYTVTITTDVTDLAGTRLAEEWRGSFTVRDGTFTDATVLDHGDLGTLSGPAVAVSDRGHGFGIWASAAGVRATHFAPPDGWPANAVGLDSFGAPGEFDVSAGHLDTALAAWSDDNGIRATHHTPPAGWERESAVLATGGNQPQVAMDASGDGLAVWLQRDDTHVAVLARHFDGALWSEASRVDSDDADAESLQLGMDQAGNGVAVWAQAGDIWSAAFRAGAWEPAALLETAPGAAHEPRLVLDGDGRGMAFWIQHDGTQYRLCWSRLDPNGGWSQPEFVDGGPAVGTGGQWLTGFAFNSRGDAVAVWSEGPDDCNPESPRPDPCARVLASRFDLAGGWQATEIVSPDHYENIISSRVAGIDRHGSILVAWTHVTPEIGTPGAWLRRYTPEQGWGEPQSLTEDDQEGEEELRELAIAVSPQGRMFLAWFESYTCDQILGKAFY